MDHLIEDHTIRATINIHHLIEIIITLHLLNIVDIRGITDIGIIRGGLLRIMTEILDMRLLMVHLHHNTIEQVLTHHPLLLIMLTQEKMVAIMQEKIHIITEDFLEVRRHVIMTIVVDTLLILLEAQVTTFIGTTHRIRLLIRDQWVVPVAEAMVAEHIHQTVINTVISARNLHLTTRDKEQTSIILSMLPLLSIPTLSNINTMIDI